MSEAGADASADPRLPGVVYTFYSFKGGVGRSMAVANAGDRPIQVGSHYHFAETNPALAFDRSIAHGQRLDIAAGTAVRFEPGQARTVELVALSGDRKVYGFAGKVMGALK